MIILGLNNVCFSYGTNKILDNATFSIQETDKVGIVGVNGAGKSTFFKIVTGSLQPDSGDVYIAKGQKTGYLMQNSGLQSLSTIWDELISTFFHLIEWEKRIKQLEEMISTHQDESSLQSLMKEYSSLTENFSRSGGYEYTSRVKGTLKGLGFSEEQFSLTINTLSGGQKTRLAMAKLLLEEPDILLLDEPTNHLDIHAIEWLEGYLRGYKKCVVVISHDRYFLDLVTNKTVEIENCECKLYNGNYSTFLQKKAADREIQEKHFMLQQKEIARMEAFIEQQRRWNREKNIVAAESRQKAIDRMEKIDKPKDLPGKIKLKLRSGIVSGNDVLFVENLTKEYPTKPLFKNISFQVTRNDRIFLLGPNGCGKSTLLKILSGMLPQTSGSFEYGHKVNMGYYDQEQADLDENNTVIDEILDFCDKISETQVRNALASFLFKGEDVFKPISSLSGGEKSRVCLVKLMLSDSNLLILDEPTNHLDINSREVLEESLSTYDGTLLVVSHDRYFIKKLATRILEFGNHGLLDYKGSYPDFVEYKNKLKDTLKNNTAPEKLSAAKLERLAGKEERAKQKRLEKQLSDTETEINELESKLKMIAEQMSSTEVSSDHVKLLELSSTHEKLGFRLEELYSLWESLTVEKESMIKEG